MVKNSIIHLEKLDLLRLVAAMNRCWTLGLENISRNKLWWFRRDEIRVIEESFQL